MKRRLLILTSMVLLAACGKTATTARPDASKFHMAAESTSAGQKHYARVPVSFSGAGQQIQAASVQVTFDPDIVNVMGVETETSGVIAEYQSTGPNQGTVLLIGVQPTVNTNFRLIVRPLTAQSTTLSLTATQVLSRDQVVPLADTATVTLKVAEGGTIQAPESQTLASGLQALSSANIKPQTVTSLPVPDQEDKTLLNIEAGDIDLDRQVTLKDAYRLTQALTGEVTLTARERMVGDLIDDMRINSRDVLAAGVKVALTARRTVLPVPSVHPKNLSVNASQPTLLTVGNAGTGRLNAVATSNQPWVRLERIQSTSTSTEGFQIQSAPDTPLGAVATITVKSYGQTRTVTITNSWNRTQGGEQRALYTIDPSQVAGAVTVVTPFETVDVAPNGSVRTFIAQDRFVPVFLKNAQGEQIALDFLIGEHKTDLKFNAQRSALAAVLTSQMFSGWNSKQKIGVMERIEAHPSFPTLVQRYAEAKRLVDDQASLELVTQIALDAGDAYALAQGHDLAEARTQYLLKPGSAAGARAAGVITPQAVTCNFNQLSTWMTITQNGNEVTVTNRGLLAVDFYLVPNDARITSFGALREKAIAVKSTGTANDFTGFGPVDLSISAARGDRKVTFPVTPGTDPKSYRVVASATIPEDQPNASWTAREINLINALNSLMGVVGFDVPLKDMLDNTATGQAAKQLAVSLTALLYNTSVVDAATAPEPDMKVIGEALTVALVQNARVFKAAYGLPSGTTEDFVSSLVERATKGAVKKAGTAAQAAHSLATIGALASASVQEAAGDFPQGVVTDQADTSTFDPGCDAVTPPPPTNPTPPLPELPPTDTRDPDEGRGNGDGSEDGGNGPTLPLPEEDGRASSFGDPHLSTFEQQVYSFQAAGEFILSKAVNDDFQVQARYTPLGSEMSANAAIAMQVAGDRVALYASKDSAPRIVVNGETLVFTAEEAIYRPLPFGGSVAYDGTQAMVVWPDGSHLTAVLGKDILGRVTLTVPPSRRGKLAGLLGNFDGNTTNDYQTRDGQVLAVPVPTPTLYNVFGESWRIQQEESLFDYGPGESTLTFTNRQFPSRYAGLHSLTPEQQASAAQICRDAGVISAILLKKCTVDVAITGNPDWAYYSAGVDPNVAGVTVAPFTAQLLVGTSLEFNGLLSGPQRLGSRELTWTATGGTVTSGPNSVRYTAPNEPGVYELTATSVADPSLTKTVQITVKEPIGTVSGVTRFVLKWDEQPNDLDAHLWLPESMPYHVYYGQPGNDDTCPQASLDIDDTDGYGPEVLRVQRLAGTGVYHVLVHRYSGTGTFSQGNATMEIVDERGTVNVVSASEGEGDWWHVLTLDAQTGAINLINTVGDIYQPYATTSAGCGSNGEPTVGTQSDPSRRMSKPVWQPGQFR